MYVGRLKGSMEDAGRKKNACGDAKWRRDQDGSLLPGIWPFIWFCMCGAAGGPSDGMLWPWGGCAGAPLWLMAPDMPMFWVGGCGGTQNETRQHIQTLNITSNINSWLIIKQIFTHEYMFCSCSSSICYYNTMIKYFANIKQYKAKSGEWIPARLTKIMVSFGE